MEAEEWDQWRNNPVTTWVMAALKKSSEAQRRAWVDASWEGGIADPLLLNELRTRADAYAAMSEVTFEGLKEIHDSTD